MIDGIGSASLFGVTARLLIKKATPCRPECFCFIWYVGIEQHKSIPCCRQGKVDSPPDR